MSHPNQKFAILDGDRLQLVTLEQWAQWMEKNRKQRILGRDVINGYVVSTIFLGLDHQWHPNGRPLYWETIISNPAAGRKYKSGGTRQLGDLMYQERYSTAGQARAGHAKAVEWLKEKLGK